MTRELAALASVLTILLAIPLGIVVAAQFYLHPEDGYLTAMLVQWPYVLAVVAAFVITMVLTARIKQ